MKIWIVLAIKQIENKIYVDNENSFYIAGVYSKKEQAEKAAANLEIVVLPFVLDDRLVLNKEMNGK